MAKFVDAIFFVEPSAIISSKHAQDGVKDLLKRTSRLLRARAQTVGLAMDENRYVNCPVWKALSHPIPLPDDLSKPLN